MSNGTLKDVSIIDLPAFGSTIVTLKKGLKKQFIWPIKTNFALFKSISALNRSTILTSYKTLTDHWREYMRHLDSKESGNFFTSEMENNRYLNFTSFIKADMKTFLIAVAGNCSIKMEKNGVVLNDSLTLSHFKVNFRLPPIKHIAPAFETKGK